MWPFNNGNFLNLWEEWQFWSSNNQKIENGFITFWNINSSNNSDCRPHLCVIRQANTFFSYSASTFSACLAFYSDWFSLARVMFRSQLKALDVVVHHFAHYAYDVPLHLYLLHSGLEQYRNHHLNLVQPSVRAVSCSQQMQASFPKYRYCPSHLCNLPLYVWGVLFLYKIPANRNHILVHSVFCSEPEGL